MNARYLRLRQSVTGWSRRSDCDKKDLATTPGRSSKRSVLRIAVCEDLTLENWDAVFPLVNSRTQLEFRFLAVSRYAAAESDRERVM